MTIKKNLILHDIHKTNQSYNIIFAGTPQFAAYSLNKLIYSRHTIKLVITKPDQKQGRGKKILFSAVKQTAQNNNIPIIQPTKLYTKKNYLTLISIQADVMIVVAYGLLIPTFILKLFPMGCINIHASLLPKLRGAAPIQWAILNNYKYTGISTIQMNEKIDSGYIIHQNSCYINKNDTTTSLTKKLCKISLHTILVTLKKINYKYYVPKKQHEKKVTYAPKINKLMGKILFCQHAKKIEHMTRAFSPWPGTYIIVNNQKIKIHKVQIIKKKKKYKIGQIIKINNKGIQIQTKKNIIQIKKIQIPGKKIIKISDFIISNQNIFLINNILI